MFQTTSPKTNPGYEQAIEMWFERAVDRLDRKYLTTCMTEAEYNEATDYLKMQLNHK